MTEKYKNGHHFWAVCVFLSVFFFFLYFGGPPWGGTFCIFFVIFSSFRDSGVFGLSPQDRKKVAKNSILYLKNLHFAWSMCQQRVQLPGMLPTGRNVSNNAGVHVPLSHCCGCTSLEQLRKHPTAGGSPQKIKTVLRENCAKRKKDAFLRLFREIQRGA